MTTDPIIDDGYTYFLSEAQDLLHKIEQDLLSLREDRTLAKVHRLMRSAHTLKGAATIVEQSAIERVAHALEDIFTALYNPDIEIDVEVESYLFQGYECLRLLLTAEFSGRPIDESDVLNRAASVIAQLQEKLGDCFQHDAPLPTSIDLGFDMVQSMFEVGVAQQLKQLKQSLANLNPVELATELQSEVEVFLGLAESLKLPGFEAIARTALTALTMNPRQVVQIAELALADFSQGHAAVLAGDRTQGGSPSLALQALARAAAQANQPATGTTLDPISSPPSVNASKASDTKTESETEAGEDREEELAYASHELNLSLENLFNNPPLEFESTATTESVSPTASADSLVTEAEMEVVPSVDLFPEREEVNAYAPIESELSLDDLFGDPPPPSTISTEVPISTDLAHPSTEYQVIGKVHGEESGVGLDQGDEIEGVLSSPIRATTPRDEIVSLDDLLDPPAVSEPRSAAFDPQTPSPVNGAMPQSPQTDSRGRGERIDMVRVGVEPLKRLDHLAGELLTNQNKQTNQDKQLRLTMQELRSHIQQHQQTAHRLQDALNRLLIGLESGKAAAPAPQLASVFSVNSNSGWDPADSQASVTTFDPLEMDRYSTLHALIQSVLNETVQLDVTTEVVDQLVKQGGQTLQTQQRLLTQVRDDLTSVRLQPLQDLLNRFPRLLNQLSAAHHKKVELTLTGAQVLVDKAIAEKLYDPLLHLVRNAFDHGVESPEIRQIKGKPEAGQIEIRAYQQAGQTVIEVKDDGQGVDLQTVIQRAIELNIAPPERVYAMPESQLLELLFEPGFSTADQLSQLSGRGIGLDVVKTQLQAMQGSVEISSTPQKGTTFYLRIPLSVTIAKLLVCRAQESAYVIMVERVDQIVVPRPDQLTTLLGGQVVLCLNQGEDEIIAPVHHLSDLVEYSSTSSQLKSIFSGSSLESMSKHPSALRKVGKSPILLLQTAAGYKGLVVDKVLGEQELVIRSVGSAIVPPPYAYGCSILSDGRLALAIDVDILLQPKLEPPDSSQPSPLLGLTPVPAQFSLPSAPDGSPAPSTPKTLSKVGAAKIMVVDDSLTLRQTLSQALRQAGYRIQQAEDGLDALTQLQHHTPSDLIICDIEMPRLDGYQFLQRLRHYPTLANIPVICLTSRRSKKHRQLALDLGAAAYFTKPYNANELVVYIDHLLRDSD